MSEQKTTQPDADVATANGAGDRRAAREERWRRFVQESPWPLTALFFASFAEALIVPIPIEVVVVPLMLARTYQVWLIATVTLAGCMVAATIGYGIGLFFFETLGERLLAIFGDGEALSTFEERFAEQGFLAILLVAVTPVPFQIAMLAAGAASYPVYLFLAASLLARGVRYFGLALAVWLLGDRVIALWRRLVAAWAGLRRGRHS